MLNVNFFLNSILQFFLFLLLYLKLTCFNLRTNNRLITGIFFYIFISICSRDNRLFIWSSIKLYHLINYLLICKLNRFIYLILTFFQNTIILLKDKLILSLKIGIKLNKIIIIISFCKGRIFYRLIKRVYRLIIWIYAVVNIKVLIIGFCCLRHLAESTTYWID